MPKRSSKDENKVAFEVVSQVTSPAPTEEEIRAVARHIGRLGGLKGGPARAKSLSPTERKAIASKAAKERWNKQK